MNASKRIQSLLDGLAQFFDKPTVIQFTDGYGHVWAGISSSIAQASPDSREKGKVVFPILVTFDKIIRVRIVRSWGLESERYIPAIEGPKWAKLKFHVVNIKNEPVKTPKPQEEKACRIHAWVTDNPKERLIFSLLQRDFDRFDREILGIETPATESAKP
jgi:hypothetical protein